MRCRGESDDLRPPRSRSSHAYSEFSHSTLLRLRSPVTDAVRPASVLTTVPVPGRPAGGARASATGWPWRWMAAAPQTVLPRGRVDRRPALFASSPGLSSPTRFRSCPGAYPLFQPLRQCCIRPGRRGFQADCRRSWSWRELTTAAGEPACPGRRVAFQLPPRRTVPAVRCHGTPREVVPAILRGQTRRGAARA